MEWKKTWSLSPFHSFCHFAVFRFSTLIQIVKHVHIVLLHVVGSHQCVCFIWLMAFFSICQTWVICFLSVNNNMTWISWTIKVTRWLNSEVFRKTSIKQRCVHFSVLCVLQTLDDEPLPTGKDYQWHNRPVSEWTNQQVCHWLMGMNMDQYTSEFTAKGVDGQQLLHLDSDKLKVKEENAGKKRRKCHWC